MNNEINNNTKLSDEQKQKVLNNFETNEQDNTYKPKDETSKAATLAVIVVIIIVVGVFLAFKFGFNTKKDYNDEILNSVSENANSFNKVIINYLERYDYKEKEKNKDKYFVKDRYYNFVTIPTQNHCFKTETSIEDGITNSTECYDFMNDIINNYCRSIKCSIPGEFDIKFSINEDSAQIEDNTTLTYDDVICTYKNKKYTCEYKK